MTEAAVTAAPADGSCSREGCGANAGGPCAEGHEERLDCEFFELATVDLPAPAEAAVARIPLPDGEALRGDELERVLGAHRASVVVPLGRVGAGKTTLIAVTYHLLRSARLRRWRFAGSETIIGLARRAWHASFASKRDAPITPRTEREESGLHLHLEMRSAEDDARRPVRFREAPDE